MTLILIAPGIEKKLSDINDTLKAIQNIMATNDDAELLKLSEDLKENTDALQSAMQNQPQQPTT